MKALSLALAGMIATSLAAQTSSPSPAAAPRNAPAAMQQMVIPSHGSRLLGVFYLAAGAEPHPTAVIFHGFPGFEQNLDLAQALRAHGWNVLAMHYRGSWGVRGDFSFTHAAEDADTEVTFLLDPANAGKYRIDTHRILVIGHSMGGYMAASAAAHHPEVAGAVLISAWNIGEGFAERHSSTGASASIADDAKALSEDDNIAPLSGTSAEALAREMHEHGRALDFNTLAGAIAPRPVFIITSNDGLASADHALSVELRKDGDTRVAERHWDTDHSYSGERTALADAVLGWTRTALTH